VVVQADEVCKSADLERYRPRDTESGEVPAVKTSSFIENPQKEFIGW